MDTWMGRNHDPITLHKYFYANADPVMYTDPTGNFSLGSLSTGMNTAARLAIRAFNTYDNITLMMYIAKGDVTLTELALTYAVAKFLPRAFFKCKNSFTGETLVHTENGLVPIREVSIGDKVWTYNTETAEWSLQEVIHLVKGEGDRELINLELITGDKIQTTSNHPFYLLEQNIWAEASLIKNDFKLLGIDGLEYKVINTSERLESSEVYNLSVSTNHNYYVGRTGILAHNCYQKPGWTSHGNKHKPKEKWSRKEIIDSTKNGPAKYFMKNSDDIRKFELESWMKGIPIKDGTNRPWKVVEFPDEIGAKNGKASKWLRLEYSPEGDVIHGHPITKQVFKKLLGR